MATLDELRAWSDRLFTTLFKEQAVGQRRPFSWFDHEDGIAAAALAFRLSALTATAATVEDGLGAALDHAEEQAGRASAEEVQIGLALFVTHNRDGRMLSKPRTVTAAPELFTPPRTSGKAPAISIGGLSPGLDYWREDVLANEHHQHWHEVYPFTGLPPRSFTDWLKQHTTDEFVEILMALAPDRSWKDIVPTLTESELAQLFGNVLGSRLTARLPRDLYRKLFRLNDRQGELFFYMHEQMLARYDAELLSHGLDPVAPYGPDAWDDPIAAGHNPIEVNGFGKRDEKEKLSAASQSALHALWDEIDAAVQSGSLQALDGGTVAIDRTNLGEAVESTASQLRELAEDAYRNLHGTGHVFLAALADVGLADPKPGVMVTPVTAIRDPVFWQWHKAINDINARWQDGLDPYRFDDAPPVVVRHGLGAGDNAPWTSPDIILCRTVDLPAGAEPSEFGDRLFGGENWATDFTAAQASADGASLETIDALTTTMGTATFDGAQRAYLTHEPFSYFLRIENSAQHQVSVTVRIFLAPESTAHERGSWIEMDKFLTELAPGRQVVYRPDTESSVVKRPAEKSPAAVIPAGADPDERSYCDCGWPYTLLLPRGSTAGMAFRLLVLCSDASIDQVEHPEHCGSMSYCGAVDRYPDTRDMGYPFSRPFAGPDKTAIRDTIMALDSAAARTVTIQHV